MQLAEVTDELMAEIVRRIVEAVDPEKIILFGSYARGNAGADSDIDLLVIKKGVENPREQSCLARASLRGIHHSFDILVRTPEHFERYSKWLGCVLRAAANEGRTIYER